MIADITKRPGIAIGPRDVCPECGIRPVNFRGNSLYGICNANCRQWEVRREPIEIHGYSNQTPALPTANVGWRSPGVRVGTWTVHGAHMAGYLPDVATVEKYQRTVERERAEYVAANTPPEPSPDDPNPFWFQFKNMATARKNWLEKRGFVACQSCGYEIHQQSKHAEPGYHRNCSP